MFNYTCKYNIQRKLLLMHHHYCPYDVKPYWIDHSTDHVILPWWHSGDIIRLTSAIRFAERRNYIQNCGKFSLSFCLKRFANIIHVHERTASLSNVLWNYVALLIIIQQNWKKRIRKKGLKQHFHNWNIYPKQNL